MNAKTLVLLWMGTLLALLPVQATEPNRALQTVAGWMQTSGNVVEARWEAATGLIQYQTRNQRQYNALYLWKPAGEQLAVSLTDAEYAQAQQADFVLVGWGQSAQNPARFFWLPAKQLKRQLTAKVLGRHELPRPIFTACFE